MQIPILRATRRKPFQGLHQLPNSQLPGHFGVGKAPFANKKHVLKTREEMMMMMI
jgi:hypothetical protein